MAVCSGASASVALPTGGDSVLVFNPGAAIAFVRFGNDGTVTASPATDFPIPPGASRLLGINPYVKWAAAIIDASGAGEVYFSRGDGTVY
jgi:hypothetical protein